MSMENTDIDILAILRHYFKLAVKAPHTTQGIGKK